MRRRFDPAGLVRAGIGGRDSREARAQARTLAGTCDAV